MQNDYMNASSFSFEQQRIREQQDIPKEVKYRPY